MAASTGVGCLCAKVLARRSVNILGRHCTESPPRHVTVRTFCAEVEHEDTERVGRLRDVSGISDYRKKKAAPRFAFDSVDDFINQANIPRSYRRRLTQKLYSRYGKSSNVHPGIIWPTKYELREMKEIEEEFEPPLEKRLNVIRQQKEEELEYRRQKKATVEKQMAKMPEIIAEYEKKLDKKRTEVAAQEAKKAALLEEARDYFGYAVNPKDDKFKAMLEQKAQKEEEERKKKRKQQKLDRTKAMLEAMVAKP